MSQFDLRLKSPGGHQAGQTGASSMLVRPRVAAIKLSGRAHALIALFHHCGQRDEVFKCVGLSLGHGRCKDHKRDRRAYIWGQQRVLVSLLLDAHLTLRSWGSLVPKSSDYSDILIALFLNLTIWLP